jgi:hypothetical protein
VFAVKTRKTENAVKTLPNEPISNFVRQCRERKKKFSFLHGKIEK